MPKFLKQVNGQLQEEATVNTSAGAGSAGKVPELDSGGRIAMNMMPTGIGAATTVLPATENLAAGDFVNVYSNSGTPSCRKADASNGRPANGFVLVAVTSGNNATIYYGDINDQCTSLTVGVDQFLSASTAGKPTATCPTGSGQVAQRLGISISATAMLVEIQPPITLA